VAQEFDLAHCAGVEKHYDFRKMNALLNRVIVMLGISLTAVAVHSQNLIDVTYGIGAGDFELGAFTGGNISQVIPAGATSIVGWTVDENTIDWFPSAFGNLSSGQLAIDLNGEFRSAGTVHTTVPTVPGEIYEVTYDVAAFVHSISPSDPKHAQVSAGNVTNLIVVTGPTIQATPIPLTWTRESFRFTALSSASDITFRSLTYADASGVLLDNVSVTHVRPVAPKLQITQLKGGRMRVCWPAELQDYTLQAARSVSKQRPERTKWVNVTTPPVCGPSSCCVTTSVAEYGKHFRLVRQ
jgi:choice-of-anchor C domain-containing protein